MSATRPSPAPTSPTLGCDWHVGRADQGVVPRGQSDLPLVARQVRFEQLSFWLNPIGAALTIGFSVVFVVIFLSTSGHSTVGFLAHINLGQYYLPAFVTYGIMAACFNILAITLVNRREVGLLKRLRLSPLPTWMLLAAIFISSMIVAIDSDRSRAPRWMGWLRSERAT